uniref:Uncharacterized protein n=1 Tax=Panagrolaimus sp. JU765 TaxID=591449 RepID=A0AC34R452_9BILA
MDILEKPDCTSEDEIVYIAVMSLFEIIQQISDRKRQNTANAVFMEERGIGSVATLLTKKKSKDYAQPMILVLNTNGQRQYAIGTHKAYSVNGTMADAMMSLFDVHYAFSIKYAVAANFYYIIEQLAGLTKVQTTKCRNEICERLNKIVAAKDIIPPYANFQENPHHEQQ